MNEKQKTDLINIAYENFNKRDIDATLQTMNPDVDWPNGWEGGSVKGYDEVRNYWTRQWKEINPVVTPVSFNSIDDNIIEVEVAQLVKNLSGEIIFDGKVKHVYSFRNNLIAKMEIK